LYADNGYFWLPLVLTAFVASLAWYGWRHRNVPGALPFALACLFGVAWSLGSVFENAAADPSAKIFWMKFATLWQLPVVTAATCFVLQYAGLGRWLNRRTLALLSIPVLAFTVLVLTDGLHHFGWSSLPLVGQSLRPVRALGVWIGLYYSYLLSLFNIGTLIWLFIRSRRHRGPVALMVLGQIGARALFEIGTRSGLVGEADVDALVLGVVFGLYAIALFGFHALDPVPAARGAALAQMHEGMLVLDLEGRIVDANRAAEQMLGAPTGKLRGCKAQSLLPPVGDTADLGAPSGPADASGEQEFELGEGASVRHYRMVTTPLTDRHGQGLGRLLLLHDVTEQKKAQAQLVDQERAVATLRERERLARELHDSVGQVLGYVSLQAQSARKSLRDGDGERADAQLGRLAEVAQDAHADVRESILALRTGSPEGRLFLPELRRCLEDFQTHYDIHTELAISDGLSDEMFEANVAVQLLRVIQEALTNARKHAEASTVRVTIEHHQGRASIRVTDDGRGFDPTGIATDPGQHFGLAFMKERMQQVGGRVRVESRPGAGTTVYLDVPIQAGEEGSG
jgi:PAS domain S-box-containing protein